MDFFNDLGKMINQAARSISARPREEAAPVQVHTFGVAEVELNRRLAELGSAYYQVTIGEREKVDPVLIERVREARETLDALAATAEAQTLRCPFCGAAQLAGARFCSSCGKPLPEKPLQDDASEEPDDSLEYCAECGAVRRNGERFCAVCGGAFNPEEAEASQPGTAHEPPEVDKPLAADAPEEPDDAERFDE